MIIHRFINMIEINKDVIFVQGYVNGAIYDLNTEKVYSVNKTGCEVVRAYSENPKDYYEDAYCVQLRNADLISRDFMPQEYLLDSGKDKMELEMAWLEITQACNMKCVHCYEGEVHKSSSETMTLSQLGLSVCGDIHSKNPRCCYDPLKGEWIKRDWQLPIEI